LTVLFISGWEELTVEITEQIEFYLNSDAEHSKVDIIRCSVILNMLGGFCSVIIKKEKEGSKRTKLSS